MLLFHPHKRCFQVGLGIAFTVFPHELKAFIPYIPSDGSHTAPAHHRASGFPFSVFPSHKRIGFHPFQLSVLGFPAISGAQEMCIRDRHIQSSHLSWIGASTNWVIPSLVGGAFPEYGAVDFWYLRALSTFCLISLSVKGGKHLVPFSVIAAARMASSDNPLACKLQARRKIVLSRLPSQ